MKKQLKRLKIKRLRKAVSKIMAAEKSNLEKAKKVLAHYPKADKVFITEDGAVFLNKSKADIHSKKKKFENSPEEFFRSFAESPDLKLDQQFSEKESAAEKAEEAPEKEETAEAPAPVAEKAPAKKRSTSSKK